MDFYLRLQNTDNFALSVSRSIIDFGCNNNTIRNQKHFANGNVADSGMIALTDEPFPGQKS